MNRFILSILTVLLPLQIMGQIFPLSDQYLNNTLAINPAFAGCHDALSATILYRNQWVGFKDAPKNSMVSVHAPFNNDRIGLGLLFENSSFGINKETSINSSYAYRIELHNGILALGSGFGLTILNVAWNELQATDAGDLLLMNNPVSAVLPDFSLGMYYYTQKYFIGFSLPMLLTHELDHSNGKYIIKNDFSEYNYFFEGGYYISLNSQIKLLPSMLIKYHARHVPQTDLNTQIIFKDRIWFGIGYRNRNMLIGMLQCQLNYQLKIAYSYDYNLGRIGNYKSGSHEVVLNYIFSYARKVTGPRQF
jgi:type IX secretion system PorP/SprF family membrane protein